MKKTRFWVLLFSAAVLLTLAGTLWLFREGQSGTIARVYQGGVLIRTIDLSRITETESFSVDGPAGGNTVEAEPGRVRISHAGCPDQVCVRQGWISGGAAPIVCLPNQLVIQLEAADSEAGADGVSG